VTKEERNDGVFEKRAKTSPSTPVTIEAPPLYYLKSNSQHENACTPLDYGRPAPYRTRQATADIGDSCATQPISTIDVR
jgi:hypothetical protein